MELSVAKNLIEQGINSNLPNQTWADLGAGDGLFTKVLAETLPFGSTVIALDRDERALKSISHSRTDVKLTTLQADLNSLPGELPSLDGVIMANSLHYLPDQTEFLTGLRTSHLKPTGVVILVEYDLEKSNPWVPYPVSRKKLTLLATRAGFEPPHFFNSVKSRLNSS